MMNIHEISKMICSMHYSFCYWAAKIQALILIIKQELRGGRYCTCIGQSQQTLKYSSRANLLTPQYFQHVGILIVVYHKVNQLLFPDNLCNDYLYTIFFISTRKTCHKL